MNIAYIDWGGTNFRCVVEGESSYSFSKPSHNINIIHELQTLFREFKNLTKVGISFAGQVQNNKIISAPNIDVQELDLNSYFYGEKEIFIENDLKCALLAEAKYWNEKHIAALYVGTGIGSAYMDGGKLVKGCINIAGEIGHIPYEKRGVLCGCGKNNCLELTASGSGLLKAAHEVHLDFKDLDTLSTTEKGRVLIADFINGVGYASSLIITLLNPKVLVLGGGIIKSNEKLLENIKSYVSKNAFSKSTAACQIKLSQLENGSLEGAKLLTQ